MSESTVAAAAPAGRSEEIDLAALVRIVWGYRWIVIATSLALGIVAAVLALTATEIFRAEVMMVEARRRGMDDIGSIAGQLGGLASLAGVNISGNDERVEARAVLQSRRLVEEFITRENLMAAMFADVGKPVELWYGVRLFRQEVLAIREDTRRGSTTIQIDWTDPERSARLANGFVALANELVRTRAVDESERNIVYLKEQIDKTNVVELQRVMYNLIEAETKTLMIAKGRPEYAFTVVDPAVPPAVRHSPRRTLMVLLGLILGGALGVMGCLAHHIWIKPHRAARRQHGR